MIFRATEQWFVGVDHNDLRGRTLKAIDDGALAASLGQVADRGDGRAPARLVHQPPAVLGRADPGVRAATTCHEPAAHRPTRSATSATSSAREGADAWFTQPAEELLPPGATCPKCGGHDRSARRATSSTSGSSRARATGPCSRRTSDCGYPTFMYLEGSDQHRGWFQSSILTAVGTTGHGALRDRADPRLRRRREGREDVQVGRQRRSRP